MLEDMQLDYLDTSKYATNAFMLALISFTQRIGCLDLLEQVHVPMKEVRHSVQEKIITLLLSYLSGCRSSHAIETELRPQALAARALGIEAFADHSSFSRFYQRIDPSALEDLRLVIGQLQAAHGLARHLQGIVLVDFDSTGLVVSGDQFELAEPGYFPEHTGASGYQLSLASASNAGHEILAHILDAGNLNPASRCWDLLYGVGESLGFVDQRLFIRADRAYGVGAFLDELLTLSVGFLIKGRDPRTAERWVRELGEAIRWVPIDRTCAVADIGKRRPPSCSQEVRTILIRTWNAAKRRFEYSYLVTTLPWSECSEVDVFHFYNERVTLEKLIERTKNVWHVIHRPSHSFWGLKFYFELRFLAYNLVLWYQHQVLSEEAGLAAMSVFELVTSMARQAVVVEQSNDGDWVIYLASAPQPVRALVRLTQAWVRQFQDRAMIVLGELRQLHYDWQTLVDAVWQAGIRLGALAPPVLCKT
jgi:hypothetical protein